MKGAGRGRVERRSGIFRFRGLEATIIQLISQDPNIQSAIQGKRAHFV